MQVQIASIVALCPSMKNKQPPIDALDAAYQAKQAFTVRYNLPGIDPTVAEGLASNWQGEVRAYVYDSDPSGGSHAGARVDERQCKTIKPIHDDLGERRGCKP